MANDQFAALYVRNGTLHIRDDSGGHWTAAFHSRSGQPYHRPIGRAGMKLYGRPTGNYGFFTHGVRSFRHGLMNAALQEGAWAWYTGLGGTKEQSGTVAHTYIPARAHTVAMTQATSDELGEAMSATAYARRGHGAAGTRGHSAINYEWCHLVAHGLGGSDVPGNLVAATCFQNTEQLIIEAVLYEYRMEGLQIKVSAKLASGTDHLAESIYYEILLGGQRVYGRTMDARRATNVSYSEVGNIAREIRIGLNNGLASAFPVDDVDQDLIDHARNVWNLKKAEDWVGELMAG
jgi:hypothetical protein